MSLNCCSNESSSPCWQNFIKTGLAFATITALVITILGGLSFYDKTQLLASPGNWAATIGGGIAFVGFGAGFIWAHRLAISRRRMIDTLLSTQAQFQKNPPKKEIAFRSDGVRQAITDLGISQDPGKTVSPALLLEFFCKMGVLKKIENSNGKLLEFEKTSESPDKTREDIAEEKLQSIAEWESSQIFTPFSAERIERYSKYYHIAVPQESAFPIDDIAYKDKRRQETGQEFFMNAVGLLFGRNSPLILTPAPAQTPLVDTKEDMWQLLWESNANVILKLTRDDEQCPRYYPFLVPELDVGEFKIKKMPEKENQEENLSEYQFSVQRGVEKKGTFLIHVQNNFTNIEEIYDLFERIESLKLFAWNGNGYQPIIIECPNGMGRSGTFAALYMIYQIVKNAQKNGKSYEINFDKLVRLMRMPPFGRSGAVESSEQFLMLEDFATHCVEKVKKS